MEVGKSKAVGIIDNDGICIGNVDTVLHDGRRKQHVIVVIDKSKDDILYEPGSGEVFRSIIPEYIGGVIYGALCECRASEQAARRMAMDTATQNAEDMIADLSLKYNQARQAAITQEITEIVAGI